MSSSLQSTADHRLFDTTLEAKLASFSHIETDVSSRRKMATVLREAYRTSRWNCLFFGSWIRNLAYTLKDRQAMINMAYLLDYGDAGIAKHQYIAVHLFEHIISLFDHTDAMFRAALWYSKSDLLSNKTRIRELVTEVINRNEYHNEGDMITLASLLAEHFPETSRELLERVIHRSKNTKAMVVLADLLYAHFSKTGDATDFVIAWYYRAIDDANDVEAMEKLGSLLLRIFFSQSTGSAFNSSEPLPEVPAHCNALYSRLLKKYIPRAHRLKRAPGCEKIAIDLYRRAVCAGNTKVMRILADILLSCGGDRDTHGSDFEAAMKLYVAAIKKRDTDALIRLVDILNQPMVADGVRALEPSTIRTLSNPITLCDQGYSSGKESEISELAQEAEHEGMEFRTKTKPKRKRKTNREPICSNYSDHERRISQSEKTSTLLEQIRRKRARKIQLEKELERKVSYERKECEQAVSTTKTHVAGVDESCKGYAEIIEASGLKEQIRFIADSFCDGVRSVPDALNLFQESAIAASDADALVQLGTIIDMYPDRLMMSKTKSKELYEQALKFGQSVVGMKKLAQALADQDSQRLLSLYTYAVKEQNYFDAKVKIARILVSAPHFRFRDMIMLASLLEDIEEQRPRKSNHNDLEERAASHDIQKSFFGSFDIENAIRQLSQVYTNGDLHVFKRRLFHALFTSLESDLIVFLGEEYKNAIAMSDVNKSTEKWSDYICTHIKKHLQDIIMHGTCNSAMRKVEEIILSPSFLDCDLHLFGREYVHGILNDKTDSSQQFDSSRPSLALVLRYLTAAYKCGIEASKYLADLLFDGRHGFFRDLEQARGLYEKCILDEFCASDKTLVLENIFTANIERTPILHGKVEEADRMVELFLSRSKNSPDVLLGIGYQVHLLELASKMYEAEGEDQKRDKVKQIRSTLVLDGVDKFYPNPKLGLEDSEVQQALEDRFESLKVSNVKDRESAIRKTFPFLKFMYIVAMENDVMLDFEDFRLLSAMDDVLEFPIRDGSRQLERYGISVDFFDEVREPETERDVISFRYGPHEHLARIVPSSLNAVGFSIMSFILAPSRETAEAYLRFVAISHKFKNCFIDTLKRKLQEVLEVEDNELIRTHDKEAPHKKVIIPLGWTNFFEVGFEFLKEHGKVGSVGISLGSPLSTSSFNQSINFSFTSFASKKKTRKVVLRSEKKLNRKSGMEYLYLNEQYRLVHVRIPRCSWKISTVEGGVSLFGFGAKMNAAPNGTMSSQREKVLCAENTVVFLSFEHFFTFNFRDSEHNGLMKRMLWFSEAMTTKNVFPRGENQNFLKALTYEVCDNPQADVFLEQNCRLHHSTIGKKKLPFRILQNLLVSNGGEYDGELFLLDGCSEGFEEDSGAHVYKAPCSVSRGELCVKGRFVSGSRDQVKCGDVLNVDVV